MSRFVSAGTIDAATGHAVSTDPSQPAGGGSGVSEASPHAAPSTGSASRRQGEWEAVSRELEEQRRQREAEARRLAEGGEKSLFAILQENKAAKQAAFEEANKIKNQFRPLDNDEVEFLEEVQASMRREEERTRREVEEGLGRFREAQRKGERLATAAAGGADASAASEEGPGKAAADGASDLVEEDWAVGGAGRKRRRKDDGRTGILKGVVRRKTSEAKPASDQHAAAAAAKNGPGPAGSSSAVDTPPGASKPPPKPEAPKAVTAPPSKPALGLVDYGSDDDSD